MNWTQRGEWSRQVVGRRIVLAAEHGDGMIKLSEQVLTDEAAMRAFYESLGISKSTTEAAIKARRNIPMQQDKRQSPPLKRKARKRAG